MSRNRDDGGRFAEKASLDDVLAVLEERDEPMTGTEVGSALGISNRSALDKLDTLCERGEVERKKVGGRSVVWWLTDDHARSTTNAETAADRLDGFGLFAGEDGEAFAEAVETSREEFARGYEERQRDLFGQ